MVQRDLGEDKMMLMGSTKNHQDFHEDGIPQLCEQVIVLVRPKDVMVYARGINHE